jgi:hypothetical protein
MQRVNGWDEKRESFAVAISNRYAAHVWLCNKTAERVSKRQNIINGVMAIIMYILGASEIPTIITSYDSAAGRITIIAMGVLTIILGMIKTLNLKIKDDVKIGKHRWASSTYAKLSNDIRRLLQKDQADREPWQTFYDHIIDQDTEIQSSAPTIPKSIIKDYYNKMGEDAIKYPALFGDIQSIKNLNKVTVDVTPSSRDLTGLTSFQTDQKIKALKKVAEKRDVENPPETQDSVEDAQSKSDIDKELSVSVWEVSDSDGSANIANSADSVSIEEVTGKTEKSQSPKVVRGLKRTLDDKSRWRLAKKTYNARDRYELDRYFIDD